MKAADADLAAMMALAQAGDQKAYGVLLDECRKWLGRFFGRRIAAGLVDDLIQETLVSLHRKRSSYDSGKPFLPWLAAIARYRWIDQLRKEYRKDETDLDFDIAVDSGEEEIAARLSLERLLGQISPAQAQVISLVKISGLSISEAAARSGQSEALVRVNIHRGLKKLAGLVESE